MAFWLMKSEPDVFGWDALRAEGEAVWDGVRNAAAANHLRAMAAGDEALFYHTGNERAAVGIMQVACPAFADPTDETGRWVAVRVAPLRKLARPVTLAAMRGEPTLAGMAILRQSRLSVAPVARGEWDAILAMAGG